jgi:serine/threonine protein kinase/WD40 repeat protein
VIYQHLEQLPQKDLEAIDALCDDYAAAWIAGRSPKIEPVVEAAPGRWKMLLALELIELESELRRKVGELPSIEDYVSRFPHWSNEIRSQVGTADDGNASTKHPLRFPGYEILGELGRGGMGVVYKARHVQLGRIVALKMAILGRHESRKELERFRIEAESIAKLQHPNIVQIFEVGEVEGTPYFTMEFVEGGNLAQFLSSNSLSPREAAQLLEPLAIAVAYAHQTGIVHRDLKPSNVLLTKGGPATPLTGSRVTTIESRFSLPNRRSSTVVEGEKKHASSTITKTALQSNSRYVNAIESSWLPKLTDFGLAKRLDTDQSHTMSGMIMGTPNYMAPEQTIGSSNNIGPAADIYSLGAILYESIVGRPPFRGVSVLETLEQVRSLEPVSPRLLQPRISRDLETICIKCLQKEPSQRYQSAMSLADDLARFVSGVPIKARPIGLIERNWRWAKRKPILAGLLATVAFLLGTVVAVPSYLAVQLDRALRESDANANQAIENQRLAESQSAKADKAKAEAESMARSSQSNLVGLRIATGINHAINDKHAQSLLWYHQAWKDDLFQSRDEKLHRLRVGFGLSQLPQLVGLCVHDKPVLDIEFDLTGEHVLVRDNSLLVSLWKPFIGRKVGEFDHGERIARAIFSVDGTQVITCGGKWLKLWDAITKSCIEHHEFESEILWCDLNPAGSHLAIGCRQGAVILWDIAGKSQYHEPFSCSDSNDAIYTQFSPDGTILIAIDTSNKLMAWRFATGELVTKDIRHQILRNDAMACLPQFVQQGGYLLTHHDGKFSCWDTSSWNEITAQTRLKQFRDIAINATGSRMVTTTGNSFANLYQFGDALPNSLTNLSPMGLSNPRNTDRCAISQNGQLVATSSSSGVIEIWNGDGGSRIDSVRMLGLPNQIRFRDGKNGETHLVAAGGDGTVRIWRMAIRGLRNEPYDFGCGCAHNAGWMARDDYRYLLSPHGEHEFRAFQEEGRVHDRVSGNPIGVKIRLTKPIAHAVFSADGQRLIVADSKSCGVYAAADGKAVGDLYSEEAPIAKISVTKDGRTLLILRAENACQVWDTDSGRLILSNGAHSAEKEPIEKPSDFMLSCNLGEIEDIAISPNGDYVLQRIAKEDRTTVFRVNDGQRVFETDFQMGVSAPISFSNDGQRFIVANSDSRARVWDLASRSPAGPFLHHPTYCRFGKLNSDGTLAATFAADKKLRIWDTANGDMLISTDVDFNRDTIWFSKDSTRLIDRKPDGKILQVILPLLESTREHVQGILELQCGEEIDLTGGISELDSQQFQHSPTHYLESWRSTVERND